MTSFGEAFKAARTAGKTTFKWQGRAYHTKTKEEMEKTMKSVPTPTPRPATNSGPRSSSVDAENAGRSTAKTAPASQPEDTRSTSSPAITPTKAEAKAETKQAATQRPRSNGKSSFLATHKGNPPTLPISKPRRTRAWANK